jgi:tetratricopeptide (TPR) repeat protein
MGIYHLHRGEYDKALKALADAQKHAKEAGDRIAVERLRVQVYVDQKKFAQAKEVVDRLVKKYPERGETYSALAEYYIGKYYDSQRESDVDEAIKALEVGVTKKFEDRETRNGAYSLLSRLRFSREVYDGALSAAGRRGVAKEKVGRRKAIIRIGRRAHAHYGNFSLRGLRRGRGVRFLPRQDRLHLGPGREPRHIHNGR